MYYWVFNPGTVVLVLHPSYKDLIAAEDKKSPMSDISIVEKLKESGISISRRTVTKYREAESIPSSRERRAY